MVKEGEMYHAYSVNMVNYLCSKKHLVRGMAVSKENPHLAFCAFKMTERLERDLKDYDANEIKKQLNKED